MISSSRRREDLVAALHHAAVRFASCSSQRKSTAKRIVSGEDRCAIRPSHYRKSPAPYTLAIRHRDRLRLREARSHGLGPRVVPEEGSDSAILSFEIFLSSAMACSQMDRDREHSSTCSASVAEIESTSLRISTFPRLRGVIGDPPAGTRRVIRWTTFTSPRVCRAPGSRSEHSSGSCDSLVDLADRGALGG